MIKKEYIIELIVRDKDNEFVAKRVAHSFEEAEEDLGKLERYVEQFELAKAMVSNEEI